MSATTFPTAAFELRLGRDTLLRRPAGIQHMLRATEDGWSLLAPDGAVIFRGLGLASRRECLERARALGVLAVVS